MFTPRVLRVRRSSDAGLRGPHRHTEWMEPIVGAGGRVTLTPVEGRSAVPCAPLDQPPRELLRQRPELVQDRLHADVLVIGTLKRVPDLGRELVVDLDRVVQVAPVLRLVAG